MKTIEKTTTIEFIEKKSTFIGSIKPVQTVKEAESFIQEIRKKYADATHNVPVYRIIENGQEYFKYNDDGEPSNTAGKPMAEILSILDIYYVVLVATRYFGGIKLGAGGLIRNYAKTAKLAIQEADIIPYEKKIMVLLNFDYQYTSEVEYLISQYHIIVIEKNYADRVTMKLLINKEIEEKISNMKHIMMIKI